VRSKDVGTSTSRPVVGRRSTPTRCRSSIQALPRPVGQEIGEGPRRLRRSRVFPDSILGGLDIASVMSEPGGSYYQVSRYGTGTVRCVHWGRITQLSRLRPPRWLWPRSDLKRPRGRRALARQPLSGAPGSTCNARPRNLYPARNVIGVCAPSTLSMLSCGCSS